MRVETIPLRRTRNRDLGAATIQVDDAVVVRIRDTRHERQHHPIGWLRRALSRTRLQQHHVCAQRLGLMLPAKLSPNLFVLLQQPF